jgi:hypothetical protein
LLQDFFSSFDDRAEELSAESGRQELDGATVHLVGAAFDQSELDELADSATDRRRVQKGVLGQLGLSAGPLFGQPGKELGSGRIESGREDICELGAQRVDDAVVADELMAQLDSFGAGVRPI